MDYTNITIFRNEFTNPILHDDEWYMMLWGYYCTWCTTITAFIMEALRSIWAIEFANITRDATTKLHDFDVNMLFASTLIYGNIIFLLVWIVRFIVGLLKDATKNKDTTEDTKDPIENTKDPIENEDPIKNTEADNLPTGAVSVDTAPPALVPEPTGPHTTIKQLRDIRSLLAKLESKVNELESLLAEESSSTSSANNNDDSTTDDSTTDDSASNERPTVFADRGYNDREEADESNERNDEREPPTMAQAKANALLWQRNQVAKMKRQSRQRRQEKKGY